MGNCCGKCERPAAADAPHAVVPQLSPTQGMAPRGLCRSVWGGGCARAAQGTPWDGQHTQCAAQQRELRRLGQQLAAARAEAARLRGAWSSHRGGSNSHESPSEPSATPQRSAAGPAVPRLPSPSTEQDWGRDTCDRAPPHSPPPRTPACTGGGGRTGECAGFFSPSPPAPVRGGSPAAAGGSQAARDLTGEPLAAPPPSLEAAVGLRGDIGISAGDANAIVASRRAELLEQQLRAAKAELWGLPALAEHGRAAVLGAECAERVALAVALQSAPGTAEPAAAQGRTVAARRGPDGVLQLRDSDGRWLSKSQFRKRYGSNRRWSNMARRTQLSLPAPMAESSSGDQSSTLARSAAVQQSDARERPAPPAPSGGLRVARRGSSPDDGEYCPISFSGTADEQPPSVPNSASDPADSAQRPPACAAGMQTAGDDTPAGCSDGAPGAQQTAQREHTAEFALAVHTIAHRVAHFVPGAFAPVCRSAAAAVAEVARMRFQVWLASIGPACFLRRDAMQFRAEVQGLLDSVLRTLDPHSRGREANRRFIRRIRMQLCIMDRYILASEDLADEANTSAYRAARVHLALREALGHED
eukprot:TRINITY_DN18567_c0_g2_i2.p1 TRINITY_DN18567_c0_g2~~TRINITY_DN18567_c0_g2_i2.p1  ORF type:complete len:587 (+),score=93.27 TRINITY_DN18567_c0_g2_i2:83-1843(+)